MPSTQQYSRAQQNRRNDNNDFDERGGTKLSIVAEVHVMEGVAEDKLMSNMSDTTTPVLNQHTYVRSPNMSTSISQFWKLPLLRPECNEEQRSFTLNARNDIINTAQQAANITVHIASPCQHCGAQLFKGEFSKISIFRHRLYPWNLNSISSHADHLLSSFHIMHSLQLSKLHANHLCFYRSGESRGICCSNGQLVLTSLPPPPRELVPLYEGTAERFQRFRRMDRKYNSSSNFCAMCVEDGELKRMFGPHFLSVQGRWDVYTLDFTRNCLFYYLISQTF